MAMTPAGLWSSSLQANGRPFSSSTEPLTPETLPYEVQEMILRLVVNDILHDLRRPSAEIPYAAKLRQWLLLRLVSKSLDAILSQMRFDSLPLDVLLRGKQLEKLEFALEAIQLTADIPPLSTRLTVPKLKRICGKFWHNPDLTADTIRTVASTINAPHALNFAIKLEPWIMRHRTRSQESSISPDGILTFEYGDWIVDAGNLRIRRVSKWLAPLWTKIARYFAHESQGPLTPIHTRLGHERRWYIEYTTDGGRQVMNCMVNYKSKMIWNQMTKKVYDFEGRLYDFGPPDDDEEPEDVWDEIEEEQE